MLSAYDENNIQARAAIRHLTGIDIRLDVLDEITAIESTEQGFNVWITTYRYQDLKRGIKVTGRGVKLVQFAERRRPSYYFHAQQHGRGAWFVRKSTAWDAEQVSEGMMGAVRTQDIDEAQHWMKLGDALAKLGTFTPYEIPAFGSRPSATEWAERVRRERMAGRVGTSTFPMDTFDRARQGYTDDGETQRMVSHWKRA